MFKPSTVYARDLHQLDCPVSTEIIMPSCAKAELKPRNRERRVLISAWSANVILIDDNKVLAKAVIKAKVSSQRTFVKRQYPGDAFYPFYQLLARSPQCRCHLQDDVPQR